MKNNKRVIFEIEASNGSTLGAFMFNTDTLEVEKVQDVSLADVDSDYIFNTDNNLYRIQFEEVNKYNKLKMLNNLSDLVGKNIIYVHEEEFGPYLFLTEDNCILIFETQEDDIFFVDQGHLGRFLCTNRYILKDMLNKGVIKEEDIADEIKSWESYQERIRSYNEERERKEYERLKAKFDK